MSLKWKLVILFYCILMLSLSVLLVGCASLDGKPSTTKTFFHDLKIEVNGQKIKGVGVVDLAPQYKIVVTPEDRIDWIVWRTSHQDQPGKKPQTGWFNKKFEFTFTPSKEIETENSSKFQMYVMNKSNETVGFVLFDFVDARPWIRLPATLKCNGETKDWLKGKSICQSARELIQEISFTTPVKQIGALPECDVMKTTDNKTFKFNIAEGYCAYTFTSNLKLASGQRLEHRLTTVGYSEVLKP